MAVLPDLVTAIFPRQSEPWVQLLRHIRQDVFGEASHRGVDLIFTGVFGRGAADVDTIQTMVEPVRAAAIATHYALPHSGG